MDDKALIQAWRERRAKRLSAREATHRDTETEEGTWVTIKGTPVLIDDKGNIKNHFHDKGAQERLGGENMKDVDTGVQKSPEEKKKAFWGVVESAEKKFKKTLGGLSARSKSNVSAVNKPFAEFISAVSKSPVYADWEDDSAFEEKHGWLTDVLWDTADALPEGAVLRVGNEKFKVVIEDDYGDEYHSWGDAKTGEEVHPTELSAKISEYLERGGNPGQISLRPGKVSKPNVEFEIEDDVSKMLREYIQNAARKEPTIYDWADFEKFIQANPPKGEITIEGKSYGPPKYLAQKLGTYVRQHPESLDRIRYYDPSDKKSAEKSQQEYEKHKGERKWDEPGERSQPDTGSWGWSGGTASYYPDYMR